MLVLELALEGGVEVGMRRRKRAKVDVKLSDDSSRLSFLRVI